MLATGDTSFTPMPMRKRSLIPIPANQYIIVDISGKIEQIEAETAYQAFKLSGTKNAIKIERLSNMRQAILKKQQFIEEDNSEQFSTKMEINPLQEIRTRRNPIISADDMYVLMKKFHTEEAPQQENISEAIGIEVHGDGFDEIIPNNQPEKPVAKKTITTYDEDPQVILEEPPQTLDAEKTLSQEEIEKLLNGN